MLNDSNMSAHVQWTKRLSEWDIPWISCPNTVAIAMGPDRHEKGLHALFFPLFFWGGGGGCPGCYSLGGHPIIIAVHPSITVRKTNEIKIKKKSAVPWIDLELCSWGLC